MLRNNFVHIQIYNNKILQSSQKSTMIRTLIAPELYVASYSQNLQTGNQVLPSIC